MIGPVGGHDALTSSSGPRTSLYVIISLASGKFGPKGIYSLGLNLPLLMRPFFSFCRAPSFGKAGWMQDALILSVPGPLGLSSLGQLPTTNSGSSRGHHSHVAVPHSRRADKHVGLVMENEREILASARGVHCGTFTLRTNLNQEGGWLGVA